MDMWIRGIPPGLLRQVTEHAKSRNMSVNDLILQILNEEREIYERTKQKRRGVKEHE